jgi:hypothetical protein
MAIPTHDPYTGELNPYYEDLTGKKNPLENYNEDNKIELFNIHFNENGEIYEKGKLIGVDKEIVELLKNYLNK